MGPYVYGRMRGGNFFTLMHPDIFSFDCLLNNDTIHSHIQDGSHGQNFCDGLGDF